MFLLLLALNFQWSSKVLTRGGSLNTETPEKGRVGGLFKAKNSIALHNLRLSAADKALIETGGKTAGEIARTAQRADMAVHSSATLKGYFLSQKSKHVVSQNSNENAAQAIPSP